MQNKLVLKDGTEIIDGLAVKSGQDKLLIRIPGNNLAEAAITFSDPKKTEEIVCYSGIHKTTFTGYTDMYSIQYFADEDYVELWLKGDETSMNDEITVPSIYVPEEKPYT